MKFKMKRVNGMPKSGQFIGVWDYKGVIWSDTYKWQDGVLKEYYDHEDDWVTARELAKGIEINWYIMVINED